MKYEYDVAVIGAGSGGLSVAYFCTNSGLRTILFEAHNMGGDCLNYGCIPSKAFIKSSKIRNYAIHADIYGVDNVDVSDTNGASALKRVQNIIEKVAPADSQERYEKMGTTVIREYAKLKDSHTINAGNMDYTSKYIVIATGSSPAKLDVPGALDVGYMNNESFFKIKELPKTLVTVGSGPVGTELSMAMSKMGVDIILLEKSDTFIPRFDEDVSKIIMRKCEELGIKVLCGTEATGLKVIDGQKCVKIEGDDGESLVRADELFMAVGRVPNIFDIGLDKLGIKYSKKGIIVDKHLKTNIKNIYAIGDCNGQAPFTHGAGYEAGIAIRNMIFKIPAKTNYHPLPWVLYTDPEVASVGFSEKDLKKKNIFYTKLETSFEDIDRAVTEGSTDGLVKILVSKKGKVLGATIVSQNAGEMLPLLVLLIQKGLKSSVISSLTFSYPTMAEAIKKAVTMNSLKKLTESNFIRNVIKFLVKL